MNPQILMPELGIFILTQDGKEHHIYTDVELDVITAHVLPWMTSTKYYDMNSFCCYVKKHLPDAIVIMEHQYKKTIKHIEKLWKQ